MSGGFVKTWTIRVIPLLALAATSVYVVVYLYRWEWHRALVAGVFMVAIEVGIGFAIVLDRLRQIETRLTNAEQASWVATRAVLHDSAPTPSQPFEWLSEASNRTSVFVPILLGAGVAISGLAWLVERIARVTAGTVLERGLAIRLQPLMVPAGVLTAGAPRSLPDLPARQHAHPVRALGFAAAIAGVLVAGVAGFDALEDATQNRPDVHRTESTGTITVRVDTRNSAMTDVETATALWGACAVQLGTAYTLTGITQAGAATIEFGVRPAIGKYAERRLRGCFEDATTDRLRAEVVAVEGSPSAR